MYKVDLFYKCYITFENNMITLQIENKTYKLKDDIFNCLFLKHTVVRRNRVDMLLLFINECLEDCNLKKKYNVNNIYALIFEFYHNVENNIKIKNPS